MTDERTRAVISALADLPSDRGIGDIHKRVLRENEREARELLASPIEFALRCAPDEGALEEVFGREDPLHEEMRDIWMTVLKQIVKNESKEAVLDALEQFGDFITDHYLHGVQYGITLGAVLEQYRTGLVKVMSHMDRAPDHSDGMRIESITRLCETHGIIPPSRINSKKESLAAD